MEVMAERNSHWQGVQKTSAGYKLLSSMGWKEGEGLGAQKQGMASHVKVSKKADNAGVGAAQEAAKARDWTLGMSVYEELLAKLKPLSETQPEKTTLPRKRRKIEKQPKSKEIKIPATSLGHPSDKFSEDKVQARQMKQPTAMKKDVNLNLGVLPKLVKSKLEAKKITHAGRFRKSARQKLVSGYSNTDLSAILGERIVEQAETPQTLPSVWPDVHIIDSKQKRGTEEANGLQSSQLPSASEDSDVAETGPLWWHGCFTLAGGVGGHDAYSVVQPLKRKVNASGFSEEDQANLWQNVTDAQNKNKKGLGQGAVLKKVAGACWEGKRTTFSEEESDPGHANVLAPSRKACASDENVTVPGEDERRSYELKKCKKFTRLAIQSEGKGRLRLKHLRSQLQGMIDCKKFTIELDTAIEHFRQSSSFELNKKWIVLCNK